MNDEFPIGWCQTVLDKVVYIHDSDRIPVNNKDRQQRLSQATTTYPYYGATGQVGEIDDFIFEGESVLLGEDGAPFLEPYKAKAYRVSGRYWVNNHAHILRGNDALDDDFLCHQLNVLDYRGYVSGTTRLKLTQANLKELPVKLAPLNEQRRIVDKIETLFARLDKGEEALRATQKLLSRYRQSVLKAAVTGELTAEWRAENAHRLEHGRDLLDRILQTRRDTWQGRGKYKEPVAPDTTDLPDLPDGWVWASVDQLIHGIEAGKNFQCDERPPAPGETGVVKISAVTWDDFNELESKTIIQADRVREAQFIRSGDLLISRANTIELVGASVVVDTLQRQLQLSDKVLRLKPVLPIQHWINGCLKSPLGRAQIESLATGAQMSMRNISQMNLRRIAVPLAPFTEIGELSKRLALMRVQFERLAETAAGEVQRLSALRQSILKDAFAGRLVPQDPDDEPASELLARINRAHEDMPKKTRRKAKI